MFSNFILTDKRYFKTFTKNLKSYYDALGVSSKATQADIKAAYYKLSMLYHPDKNKGSKIASEKFQAINTAYEILGNYTSRKLYDKGVLNESIVGRTTSRPMNRASEEKPVPSGRVPIYDFDEWSRAHYGYNLSRRAEARRRFESDYNDKILDKHIKYHNITFAIILLFLTSLAFSAVRDDDFDIVEKKKFKKQ